MMLGPKAFGFPVGRRLHGPRHSEISIQAEQTSYWFYFSLPVPEDMQATHATTELLLLSM
jgi:hypothetical protein